ncbi:MAG: M24 family metallopeptidase [Bacteroidota bacterium]
MIGNRIDDISKVIQRSAEAEGYSVGREFFGAWHRPVMDEDPRVPHFSLACRGYKIKVGLVFTIEPIVNARSYLLTTDSSNGWLARTKDESLEHTIAITVDGPISLTKRH